MTCESKLKVSLAHVDDACLFLYLGTVDLKSPITTSVCVSNPTVTLGWMLSQSHSNVINSLLGKILTGSVSEVILQK